MRVGIASDHRGFETKEKMTKYLIEKGYDVIDYGTYSKDRTDYTKYGFILGENVSNKTVEYVKMKDFLKWLKGNYKNKIGVYSGPRKESKMSELKELLKKNEDFKVVSFN